MIELINWIKDGKYRIHILELLHYKPYLSSELALKININRASMSRILGAMKEKGLIDYVSSGSRTRSYIITDLGKRVYNEYIGE